MAASHLSVAHPPGYPLYVLLGWLWAHVVPLGDLAHRLNLLSATCAATACGLAGYAAREMIRSVYPHARSRVVGLGAAVAALLLGVGPPVWGQAVVISVYTLNLALSAALLLVLLRAVRLGPSVGRAVLFGGLLGLGLGNHLSLAAVGPVAAMVAAVRRWPLRCWTAGSAAALGCALLIYGYFLLPGLAARDPVGAWGDLATPPGVWRLVSAADYRLLVGRLSAAEVLHRLPRVAALIAEALTPIGVVAAAMGTASLIWPPVYVPSSPRLPEAQLLPVAEVRRPGRWTFLTILTFLGLVATGFATTYGGARSEHHLLPLYLALSLLSAIGFTEALRVATAARWRAGVVAALLALLAIAAWRGSGAGAAGDYTALEYARSTLEQAPTGGCLIVEDDGHVFALWYAQLALGVRPDVAVVQPGLWATRPGYRAKLLAAHPQLRERPCV